MLILGQVLWGLCVVGRYVFRGSELPLVWDRGLSEPRRLRLMCGEERGFGEAISRGVPPESAVLLLSPEPPWIASYYLLPRKVYWYRRFSREEDAARVPQALLREKGIGFVLWRGPSEVKVLRVRLPGGEAG